jgi:hypothetical protein
MSLVEGGDTEAFAALYDRYCRLAYSVAHKLTGEKQAAEDLTQDAFLKVWRSTTEGQRQDLDPLGGPQPRHRPAARESDPPQDAGEGRGIRTQV